MLTGLGCIIIITQRKVARKALGNPWDFIWRQRKTHEQNRSEEAVVGKTEIGLCSGRGDLAEQLNSYSAPPKGCLGGALQKQYASCLLMSMSRLKLDTMETHRFILL